MNIIRLKKSDLKNRLTINAVMKMSNTVAWKLGCDKYYTYDEKWTISLMGTYTCIITAIFLASP